METTAHTTRMHSLVVLYDMHTTYLPNALEGISQEDAHKRLDTKANHIAWITGSIVHERFELAKLLGIVTPQQTGSLFENHQGIKDDVMYPTMELYLADWLLISPILRKALVTITDEKLDVTFEMMPGVIMSHYDLISFMTYREANCIGQIALWRRLLGYAAMKYM